MLQASQPLTVKNKKTASSVWGKYKADPIKFGHDVCGVKEFASFQRDILRAMVTLDNDSERFGAAYASAQGVGKTLTIAVGVLWFLCTKRNSFVLCTSGKEQQLRDVLWIELSNLITSSQVLNHLLEWHPTSVDVKGHKGWQAVARTAKNPANFSGHHRDEMLLVVEEATGVASEMLEVGLGTLTGRNNYAILLSQPTDITSEFGRCFRGSSSDLWITKNISAAESPFVSKAQIERMTKRYGKGSAPYLVRVMGEFPAASEFALISMADIESARARELPAFEPGDSIQIGVDIARYGSDSSAATVVMGGHILSIERWHGSSTVESADRITDITLRYMSGRGREQAQNLIAKSWHSEQSPPDPFIESINIDEIGVGAGVLDDLIRRQYDSRDFLPGIDIRGINVATAAADKQRHRLLRDELWFGLADRYREGRISFDKQVSPDELEILEGELGAIEYRFDRARGAVQRVLSKDEIRTKLGASPDIGDSLCLAVKPPWHESTVSVVTYI